MQVDFEMEYDDDEEELSIDLELEEIALLTNEDVKSAQGLSLLKRNLLLKDFKELLKGLVGC